MTCLPPRRPTVPRGTLPVDAAGSVPRGTSAVCDPRHRGADAHPVPRHHVDGPTIRRPVARCTDGVHQRAARDADRVRRTTVEEPRGLRGRPRAPPRRARTRRSWTPDVRSADAPCSPTTGRLRRRAPTGGIVAPAPVPRGTRTLGARPAPASTSGACGTREPGAESHLRRSTWNGHRDAGVCRERSDWRRRPW